MVETHDGRQVYLCTRTRSQTVNICDANNRRGQYDWIVRLFQPQVTSEAEIAEHLTTAQTLIEWLTVAKAALVETQPPQNLPPHPPPPADETAFTPDEGPWIEEAVSIVEQAIDQLIREFLRVPFLHRVEHSLHARLFSILAAQPHFARELPLRNPALLTQPLHKEWPETIPEENTKRGNFDLAVLTPWQLANCNVGDFRNGRLRAPIVIEMGLDYRAPHLAEDRDKLLHSQVHFGYLVHLTRLGVESQAEEIILNPDGQGHIRTAYACVCGNVRRYKLLNGDQILAA